MIPVRARRGCEESRSGLELDLEPHRRPAERALTGLDGDRGLVVVGEVERVLILPRFHPIPTLVQAKRQPEHPTEREGLAGLIDDALAIRDEADWGLAPERKRPGRPPTERARHHDELGVGALAVARPHHGE